MNCDVSLVPCADYSESKAALSAVLEPIGGLDWVKPGMKIVIKANLVTAMKPDSAGVTHPALVCALSQLLTERGAEAIVGDSPGGIYSAAYLNRVYSVTGMREAEKYGASLNMDFSQSEAAFPGAAVLRSFTCTSYLLKADAIIDFCKLKSHGMMGMSAAVKNMFGAIPGTMKPEYHFKFPNHAEFADMLVDLNEYFKPRLSIADAVIGMEGNGPTAGSPRKIGALAASFSPYMLDLVCARMIGLGRENVPTLESAFRRGLAPGSADEVKVAGLLEELVVHDFKNIAAHNGILFNGSGKNPFMRVFSSALGAMLRSSPHLKPKLCIGCGICANTCPAKAIIIKDGLAKIDFHKCIRCFCCQEFCPKGAMQVKRSAAARLASRL